MLYSDSFNRDTGLEFSTFEIGGVLFGIDILNIQEINRQSEVTRVPHARAYIRGILNLRGNIVTIVDLGRRLGLPRGEDSRDNRNIIVESEGEQIGLFVGRLGDVVKAVPGEIDPAPASISKVDGRFFQGVLKTEDQLIGLLDIERIMKD